LAARTTDEQTLQLIDADLARWREAIKQRTLQSHQVIHQPKWLDRFVSWSVVTFWTSFILMYGVSAVLYLSRFESAIPIFLPVVLLLLVGSGAGYLVAIAIREATARRWRFTVRGLLILMTVVALLLGFWFWAVRY
jgi:hypothetical protein